MTIFTTLQHHTCARCGGLFAISAQFRAECARLGGFKQMWACPYCKTTWGFGEGEVDTLKRQIKTHEVNEKWLREQRDRATKEAEHFRKSRDGIKGALTKVKKRVRHGVCPCCQRTFKQLAAHMAAKHPDYAKPDERQT